MLQTPNQPTVVVGQTEYAVSAAAPENIQLAPDGACAVFTVRPGDVAPYDRIRRRPYERAEFINLKPFAFGEAQVISFMQYIAPGSAASGNRPAVIGQIHNTGGQTRRPQPFVAMQVVGTRQRIVTFSGGGEHQSRKSVAQWEAPVEAGRWTQWTWEFVPDRTETKLQVWRDGVQLFPAALELGGYDGPRGPYWQFGIYRSKDTTTMRVGYAEMTVRSGPLGSAAKVGTSTVPAMCSVEPVG